MRFALAFVLLAACHTGDRGPAWPKRADRANDGGESLAPHQAGSIAAATSTDDEDAVTEDKPAEKATAPAAPVDAVKLPTATPTGDDSLFGDDITIDVED